MFTKINFLNRKSVLKKYLRQVSFLRIISIPISFLSLKNEYYFWKIGIRSWNLYYHLRFKSILRITQRNTLQEKKQIFETFQRSAFSNGFKYRVWLPAPSASSIGHHIYWLELNWSVGFILFSQCFLSSQCCVKMMKHFLSQISVNSSVWLSSPYHITWLTTFACSFKQCTVIFHANRINNHLEDYEFSIFAFMIVSNM